MPEEPARQRQDAVAADPQVAQVWHVFPRLGVDEPADGRPFGSVGLAGQLVHHVVGADPQDLQPAQPAEVVRALDFPDVGVLEHQLGELAEEAQRYACRVESVQRQRCLVRQVQLGDAGQPVEVAALELPDVLPVVVVGADPHHQLGDSGQLARRQVRAVARGHRRRRRGRGLGARGGRAADGFEDGAPHLVRSLAELRGVDRRLRFGPGCRHCGEHRECEQSSFEHRRSFPLRRL